MVIIPHLRHCSRASHGHRLSSQTCGHGMCARSIRCVPFTQDVRLRRPQPLFFTTRLRTTGCSSSTLLRILLCTKFRPPSLPVMSILPLCTYLPHFLSLFMFHLSPIFFPHIFIHFSFVCLFPSYPRLEVPILSLILLKNSAKKIKIGDSIFL